MGHAFGQETAARVQCERTCRPLEADIARALGGWSERVTEPGEIKDAFLRARGVTEGGRAALLEFVTSEEHTVSHLHDL